MRPDDRVEPRPRVAGVAVVIPARNEQVLIGPALDSVTAAVAALDPHVPAMTVVVLDRCTDGTAEVVNLRGHSSPGRLATVAGAWAGMGQIRSAGVERARALLHPLPADGVWIACTDADSTVPPHWLTAQLAIADTGIDLVLGTVEPEPDGTPAARLWHATHRLTDGHSAIHGANLGVRLSAHDAAGGFGARRSGEDVDLVARIRRRSGLPWRATDAARVQTSPRREGRAVDGFAQFMRRLDRDADAGTAVESGEALPAGR